ncbi:taste receptor type 2 member 1 [Molossus molossus]|uniref:Taste receptor type 2 n=1 Tax=Molossus molossus TaxID=27622 RepID=A0A7J8J4Z9_MOLMO|nr:taste receptor type 2 member 1 [Molossus molossus]KAF6491192.1 taste 2 receptor member 1 [Molossus molossus]
MLQSHIITHLIFSVIQFLIAVLANGIIVVVNGTELIKQRKMVPLDLLLCCLATSRICLQIVITYSNLAVLSLTDLPLIPWISVIFMYIHELELWLATWLSVFYCLKIVTIAHPLFLWLKLRISKLVPWLILGSLLYISFNCVFYHKYIWIISQKSWLGLFSENATTQTKDLFTLQFALLLAELLLPLLIFLISALLVIFSLGRHTQQMMSMTTGPRHPRMNVYISTLLSILSFLVLYLSQYMMAALVFFEIFKVRNFIFLFCLLVFGSYPSVHSVILILGNPKLRQNAKKFLLHSKCCP